MKACMRCGKRGPDHFCLRCWKDYVGRFVGSAGRAAGTEETNRPAYRVVSRRGVPVPTKEQRERE